MGGSTAIADPPMAIFRGRLSLSLYRKTKICYENWRILSIFQENILALCVRQDIQPLHPKPNDISNLAKIRTRS
jgi:hypothetical protein